MGKAPALPPKTEITLLLTVRKAQTRHRAIPVPAVQTALPQPIPPLPVQTVARTHLPIPPPVRTHLPAPAPPRAVRERRPHLPAAMPNGLMSWIWVPAFSIRQTVLMRQTSRRTNVPK